MLTQAYQLDFSVAGSALEAALMETDEIKHRSPQYNIALRGGRRELVFGSRDLQDFTRQPDKAHPIGPLPAGNLMTRVTNKNKSHSTPNRFPEAAL